MGECGRDAPPAVLRGQEGRVEPDLVRLPHDVPRDAPLPVVLERDRAHLPLRELACGLADELLFLRQFEINHGPRRQMMRACLFNGSNSPTNVGLRCPSRPWGGALTWAWM